MEESPTKYNQYNQRYTPREDASRDNDFADHPDTNRDIYQGEYENQFQLEGLNDDELLTAQQQMDY